MADFQTHLAEFDRRNIKVLAASVDPAEKARKTEAKDMITFPLAYGLDAKEFCAATGAFYDAQNLFNHAAGFLIRPDASVADAVYSTGAIGRYVASDCLSLIDYLAKKAP